jgi:RHS repeat-associated protein
VAVAPSQTTTLTYLYDQFGHATALSAQVGTAPVCFAAISTTLRGDVISLNAIESGQSPLVLAAYDYDEYGNPSPYYSFTPSGDSSVSAAVAAAIYSLQPLRYAGYTYDSYSGLYYCSQRYYDPATAQWISPDPANADGEQSAYQYCGGDPINGIDPSGLYYCGTSAVRWAEAHWHSYSDMFQGYGSDCANFVSQCLWAGGWEMNAAWHSRVAVSAPYEVHPQLWDATRAWAGALKLFDYVTSGGRGHVYREYTNYRCGSSSYAPSTIAGARKGDLVFYEWHGTCVDHVAIIADPCGIDPGLEEVGTLIDQHTKDRHHALWNLREYSQNRPFWDTEHVWPSTKYLVVRPR